MTGGPRVSVTLLSAVHRSVIQRGEEAREWAAWLGRQLGRLLAGRRVRTGVKWELGRLAWLLFILFF